MIYCKWQWLSVRQCTFFGKNKRNSLIWQNHSVNYKKLRLLHIRRQSQTDADVFAVFKSNTLWKLALPLMEKSVIIYFKYNTYFISAVPRRCDSPHSAGQSACDILQVFPSRDSPIALPDRNVEYWIGRETEAELCEGPLPLLDGRWPLPSMRIR